MGGFIVIVLLICALNFLCSRNGRFKIRTISLVGIFNFFLASRCNVNSLGEGERVRGLEG
jgi:hypothetical protein